MSTPAAYTGMCGYPLVVLVFVIPGLSKPVPVWPLCASALASKEEWEWRSLS